MALAIDAASQATLDSGRSIERGLLLFNFPSGTYGFWTGLGPFVYNSITYVGAGTLIELDDFEQSMDGSAVSFVLSLTAIPNSELSPDVLATIESEDYHNRPMTVATAYFDPDTAALLSVETEIRGYVDKIVHQKKSNGDWVYKAYCESKALDNQKTGYNKRDDQNQRLINSTDRGLRWASNTRAQKIYWGRATPAPAPKPVTPPKYGRR